MESTFFTVVAITAIVLQSFLIFLFFFEPGLRYKVCSPPSLDSREFLNLLEALVDARCYRSSCVEVLTNGEAFYASELKAIREAQKSINLEAYIFQQGEVTRRFVEAFAERARAGVKVNLVIDAIGSFATSTSYFAPLSEAGGRVERYHPVRWDTLARFNNRTHRVLLVIDGRVGFLGGAGFADQWLHDTAKNPRWRDTIVRVHGEVVTSLQAAFAENWLESSGEILSGEEYFPFPNDSVEAGASKAQLVVRSSPSMGRSTRARILFQTLLASAEQSICLATPYFLPDQSARAEMLRAMRERGVRLRILAPGKRSDQLLTRRSSRRLYGELLQAGAQIYEYQPAMMHTKALIVDNVWSIVGSTNFDHRSFGLNDELNLVCCDDRLAARLTEDFEKDLKHSHLIEYSEWKQRSLLEKAHECLGWVLERQQ
ncbi:MAG: phospholipase D-like domain-containing protein [Acidobacteria bacterium]|nr:phospholipase D-like domain-containing protein [Acidobacteriota bacterium]MCI0628638.1 phospholipase D-like domain-containing protein [Acidobacteriota bacterium]MCI0723024.1 phospholipase D-like domain-containing protein [Acidobacteriota bacterium]